MSRRLHLDLALQGVAVAALLALAAWAPLTGGADRAWGEFGLRALVIVAASAGGLAWLAGARPRRPAGGPLLALGLYLGLAGLSTWAAPDHFGGLRAYGWTLLNAAAFGLGALWLGGRQRGWLVGVLLLAAALAGLYGLLQAAGLGFTDRLSEARVSGPFFNSNHYAGFLTLVLPLALGRALAAGRGRVWSALLAALLALNLILSFAWGLLPAGLVCAGLLWPRLARRRAWTLAGLVALALLAVAALRLSPQLSGPGLGARAAELGRVWVRQSLDSRVLIWRGAAQVALDQPWLGAGPGHFAAAFTHYRSPRHESFAEAITHGEVSYAQQDYLQVAAETGLPGLLAFLAFWGLALWPPRAADPDPDARALRAGLLALLLYGLLDGNLTAILGNALLAHLAAGALNAGPRLAELGKPA